MLALAKAQGVADLVEPSLPGTSWSVDVRMPWVCSASKSSFPAALTLMDLTDSRQQCNQIMQCFISRFSSYSKKSHSTTGSVMFLSSHL